MPDERKTEVFPRFRTQRVNLGHAHVTDEFNGGSTRSSAILRLRDPTLGLTIATKRYFREISFSEPGLGRLEMVDAMCRAVPIRPRATAAAMSFATAGWVRAPHIRLDLRVNVDWARTPCDGFQPALSTRKPRANLF